MNKPAYVVTDENIEEMLLLSYLTGMTFSDAAYAVIPGFDHMNATMTIELTVRLFEVKKKLDGILKQAHSPPTQQPEYVNAEEGRTHESELVPESRPRG